MEDDISYVVAYFNPNGYGLGGRNDDPWLSSCYNKEEAFQLANKLINHEYAKVKIMKNR